jgi:hypothetical protein
VIATHDLRGVRFEAVRHVPPKCPQRIFATATGGQPAANPIGKDLE